MSSLTVPFVVDSSAVLAIFMDEPEAQHFQNVIARGGCFAGAPTLVEIWTSLIRKTGNHAIAASFVEGLVEHAIQVIPFTADHMEAAGNAYARFGKGRHPAKLNYGDCMAYAAAKVAELPLLFKGADFGLTDIAVHPNAAVLS